MTGHTKVQIPVVMRISLELLSNYRMESNPGFLISNRIDSIRALDVIGEVYWEIIYLTREYSLALVSVFLRPAKCNSNASYSA